MKKYSVVVIALSFLLIVVIVNILMISCSDDDDDDATPTPTPTVTITMTPTPEPGIIPGYKNFNLFISDEFSTCRDKYGDPDYSVYVYGFFLCIYFDISLTISVEDVDNNEVLDESDPLDSIGITLFTNFDGQTASGNGIDSSLESVIAEFGQYESEYNEWYRYSSIGIDWNIPSSSNKCEAISVSTALGNEQVDAKSLKYEFLNMMTESSGHHQ